LTIVLPVRLRFTDSNYPFGIFKIVLSCDDDFTKKKKKKKKKKKMYKEPNSRRELSVAHSNWTLIFFSPLLVVRMSLMFVRGLKIPKE
jgi:hypothetical protein